MAEPIVLTSEGIAKIAAQLAMSLRQDAQLRAIQSRNALIAKYFEQTTITGATVFTISQARQSNQELFADLVIVFDAANGTGRYRIDGQVPTPGTGLAIAAGYSVLTIPGHVNIANFAMVADALQTLSFARILMV